VNGVFITSFDEDRFDQLETLDFIESAHRIDFLHRIDVFATQVKLTASSVRSDISWAETLQSRDMADPSPGGGLSERFVGRGLLVEIGLIFK
jgi:hypothetical protein